ncbi:AraC family transcriptional regulator [Caballeronia novacaledonica]|uniref:AraC family transcriptional regulator n=1 Tax=Caballeronia novacaledonica TaxID=1544861 RepID=UPI0038574A77
MENPTLDAIAEVAGMSTYQLIRVFKHSVGMAPHAYLVQRRVAWQSSSCSKGSH